MKHTWLVAWILVLLAHSAIADELKFSNFTKTVTIQSSPDTPYWESGDGQRFQIASRVIVRADTDDGLLHHAHPAITQVQPLFLLGETRIYLLHFDVRQANLQTVMNALEQRSDVHWAQPDLLQQRAPAHIRHWEADDGRPAPQAIKLNWSALQQHNRGQGVSIAIIDDGIDFTHPALQHTQVAFRYDIEQRQLSASPTLPTDTHGTQVAGVLFARTKGQNHQGLVPDATLIAIRQPDTWTSNTVLAFHLAQLAGADIINCSWHSHGLLQPVADAVTALAQHGRNGLGTAVVFAAGNQGQHIDATSSEAAIAEAIVVGLDSPHSNFGPSVDLILAAQWISSTTIDGGFAPFGGTSLASSKASAALALLLARNPQQRLPALLNTLKQEVAHD